MGVAIIEVREREREREREGERERARERDGAGDRWTGRRKWPRENGGGDSFTEIQGEE